MVEQQQASARAEDSPHLADRRDGAGYGAQRQRADHSVERGVVEWQVFGVACAQVNVTAEACRAMLAIARRRAAGLGRDVDLREGDAEHLPFDDASFDTVACTLSLCTIPSPEAAIAEMRRVLGPGGHLLLLDHIGSTWPPIYAAQWLVERITIRTAGEHFTRRQLSLVKAAGFQIVETERLKGGTVERIHAVKPA